MTKVSAVMALYNTPFEYLQKTVESILNQSLKDFEFIIIDDASSVLYDVFFKQFNDDRIKYFKLEKNSGPGAARNEGIKKAQGEYIAIIDSDDIYLPQRFEKQVEFLDKNPDISLINAKFKRSDNGKISQIIESDENIKLFMLFNSPIANPIVMFRRNDFCDKNLYYPEDKRFGEDYELWLDAMFAGLKFAGLDEVLMIYTRRKNQLSKSKQDEQISILKSLYKKIFLNLGFEATQEEIDLHYNLERENYGEITPEQIENWFNKIIDANKTKSIFSEEKLQEEKAQILENFEKLQKRLFKIKIFGYNFCVYKPFQITFEQR